jgi:hypothetical protein
MPVESAASRASAFSKVMVIVIAVPEPSARNSVTM